MSIAIHRLSTYFMIRSLIMGKLIYIPRNDGHDDDIDILEERNTSLTLDDYPPTLHRYSTDTHSIGDNCVV